MGLWKFRSRVRNFGWGLTTLNALNRLTLVNRGILLAVAFLGQASCGVGSSPGVLGDAVAEDTEKGDAENGGPVVAANACDLPADCSSGEGCSTGVCVALSDPETPSTVTSPLDNVPTADAPDLSCVGVTPDWPLGPAAVTLYGAVTRFGSGLKTYDIKVEVFEAASFDPSECEALSSSKQAACYADYGESIGEALSKKVVLPADLPETCGGHGDCPLGYRCIEGDLDFHCLEQFGVFEIEGVPTNTPLVIRSSATKSAQKWHTTYSYNVVLFADNVGPEGRAHFDATMVSHGQWLLTPNTVGLGDIAEDRGVLGGRVRDCYSADRESWAISNVKLGLASPAKKIVFFNALEDDTVPMADRVQSNILGRFAALDVAAGWNTLAGYASIGEQSIDLGALPVYIFPNSLTVVTWPGLRPYWPQE